jgi:predicted secreted hydrolase
VRRPWRAIALGALATSSLVSATLPAAQPATANFVADYPSVIPGRALTFPRDFGSHPEFRTEWWYVTGWLSAAKGEPLGFQVTFFRARPQVDPANPSAFAAHQLLIAHCAISDPRRGRLWQDQRIRRAGLGLAEAAESDTRVWIDDWSLVHAEGRYTTSIDAENFAMHLVLEDTQPPMLNGTAGVSRKGPAPEAASYYYSLPHMRVSGSITREGSTDEVSGEAWFDHEWSSQYLDEHASGWDWIGINLDDGSALMAFRIRGLDGSARWTGGTLRGPDGRVETLDTTAVTFEPGREWTSPRTGIKYPVEWHVTAGKREFDLRPLLDDQENDTRLSTGAIYWEGAIRVTESGRAVGRGYLELTGYGEKLTLR